MTTRKIIAAIVLADFAVLNAYAVYAVGLSGLADFVSNLGPWGWVLCADLLIALGMVIVWMWKDATARGKRPIGYVALTLATGSIGPLVYLLTRPTAADGRDASTDLGLATS